MLEISEILDKKAPFLYSSRSKICICSYDNVGWAVSGLVHYCFVLRTKMYLAPKQMKRGQLSKSTFIQEIRKLQDISKRQKCQKYFGLKAHSSALLIRKIHLLKMYFADYKADKGLLKPSITVWVNLTASLKIILKRLKIF